MSVQSVCTVAPGEPLDRTAIHRYITATALRPSPIGKVGLELESHLVDLADPAARVPWARIREFVSGLPSLPGRSRVTIEPGGQIELSGAAQESVDAAIRTLRRDQQALRETLAEAGLGAATLGADPARPPRRVNPGDRYVAMERHFAETGKGEPGLAMMCSTAALQVNLDAGPESAWAGRVGLAQRLAPVLVALSACSPLLAGSETGWRSSRQRVWAALDEHRRVPAIDAELPAQAWADYALDAPVMMIHSGQSGECVPVRRVVPLRSWADGTERLGGRAPTVADVDHHLTTLFPSVRLRGYLEIRCLDAMPDRWWPALAAMTCVLMDDPSAARAAAAAIEPVAGDWRRAARDGVSDPAVRAAALGCLEASAAAAPPAYRSDLQTYAQIVATGRTPGDDLLNRARVAGPLAVLEEAAHA